MTLLLGRTLGALFPAPDPKKKHPVDHPAGKLCRLGSHNNWVKREALSCLGTPCVALPEPAPPLPGAPGDPLRAPSVHYLKEVLVKQVEACGLASDSTVHEIEAKLIRTRGASDRCPRDGRMGAAFVDTLHGEDQAGRANFMLSYTWANTLADIVDALSGYCDRHGLDPRRTYVWICVLCINQHRVQEATRKGEAVPFEQFAAEFSSRVRGIGHVLALMGTWQSPKYITRAWCIYELYTAMVENCGLDIIMPSRVAEGFLGALIEQESTLDDLWEVLTGLDVQKADASIAEDKKNILRLVEEGPGSGALNQKVRRKLQIWFAETAEHTVQAHTELRKTCRYTCERAGQASVKIGRMLMELNALDRLLKCTRWWHDRLLASACGCTGIAASNLANMGVALLQAGDLEAAQEKLGEALRIRQATATLETPAGADLLRFMSMLRASQGDMAGALADTIEAMRILKATSTVESLDGATLLVRQGIFYGWLKQSEMACRCYEEAQRIYESLNRMSTLKGAHLLAVMAYVDVTGGHVRRASEKCLRAQGILEDTGTLETPNGAHCLTIIGWVKANLGDMGSALDDCQEALRIHEACDTVETPHGLDCLVFLAYLKDCLGDAHAAARLKRQASAARISQGSVPVLRLAPAEFYH